MLRTPPPSVLKQTARLETNKNSAASRHRVPRFPCGRRYREYSPVILPMISFKSELALNAVVNLSNLGLPRVNAHLLEDRHEGLAKRIEGVL